MYQYWRFYWPLALTGVGLVLALAAAGLVAWAILR